MYDTEPWRWSRSVDSAPAGVMINPAPACSPFCCDVHIKTCVEVLGLQGERLFMQVACRTLGYSNGVKVNGGLSTIHHRSGQSAVVPFILCNGNDLDASKCSVTFTYSGGISLTKDASNLRLEKSLVSVLCASPSGKSPQYTMPLVQYKACWPSYDYLLKQVIRCSIVVAGCVHE